MTGCTNLGGDADGAAILLPVGDVDRLRLLPIAEAEQPFAGAVRAGLLGGDTGAANDEALRQLNLQGPRDRGHGWRKSVVPW